MNSRYDYRPGDRVSVRFGGVLRHYGIVSWGGRVISNNGRYGGVVSQSLSDFARGREITNHGPEAGHDYLGPSRATRRLGHDYHLTGSNCVHFVRHAQGRKPTATQVARGTFEAFRDMLGGRRR
ncbi:C40 family peptidase [Henriciella aquimarina]|uniref:hypothetical protein n=1 Tax=Henriciella aquimarina TaxID=545261 RepID=UPI0009FBBC59|nr:hypothetical protein [Henriciella aquimarina]